MDDMDGFEDGEKDELQRFKRQDRARQGQAGRGKARQGKAIAGLDTIQNGRDKSVESSREGVLFYTGLGCVIIAVGLLEWVWFA